jgi:hypothetical protein
MPLIRNINIDDLRFVKQLNVLDGRREFIRELASVILPLHAGFESVWSIANRVYDQHCSPRATSLNCGIGQPARTALSA